MNRTAIIGPDNDGYIEKGCTFCLNSKNDDQLIIESSTSTLHIRLTNGYINEKREDYYTLEIDKASPFYTNFKKNLQDLLDL